MGTLETLAAEWGIDVSGPSPIVVLDRGRLDLARLFCTIGYRQGAEIGVERGLYSEQLCLANPTLKLLAVDPWRAYRAYRDHTSQSKLDDFYAEARARLDPYGVTFVRRPSTEAAETIPGASLDFVYIDANHSLPYVIADIAAWEPKVRPGGIVAGHDFVKMKWVGKPAKPYTSNQVVAAVTTWTAAYGVAPWFVLRGDAQNHEGPSTWMWVKP